MISRTTSDLERQAADTRSTYPYNGLITLSVAETETETDKKWVVYVRPP